MNHLVIDRKLTTLITDHEHTHTAASIVERVTETMMQTRLINDGQALLDIARLGHGDDTTVIADVEHAVLLEDGPQHVLHDDGGRGVGDEGGLFVELLGEEVDAEIAMLARLGRGGDADDLAGTTLQDHQIANADVVAWDGDGVGRVGPLAVAWHFGFYNTFGAFDAVNDNVFFAVVAVVAVVVALMMVVVVWAVDGMEDTVGGALQTVTEGVIVAVFVVISHIRLVVVAGRVDGSPSLFYSNFLASFRVAVLRIGLSNCWGRT